jgi:predicted NBD/HSP70 family sugar kinase
MDTKLYATIEGGGTKFICAVMDAERRILTEARFPCQNPSETIANCLNFFLTTQSKHLGRWTRGLAPPISVKFSLHLNPAGQTQTW